MSTYQKSKYDCFNTFDVLLVDIGCESSTRTYSSSGVKFKYSDMGYPSICSICIYICIQVRTIF